MRLHLAGSPTMGKGGLTTGMSFKIDIYYSQSPHDKGEVKSAESLQQHIQNLRNDNKISDNIANFQILSWNFPRRKKSSFFGQFLLNFPVPDLQNANSINIVVSTALTF